MEHERFTGRPQAVVPFGCALVWVLALGAACGGSSAKPSEVLGAEGGVRPSDASADRSTEAESPPSVDASHPGDAGEASANDASQLPSVTGTPGVWVNVSPPALTALLPSSFGAGSVVVDPARPQDLYTSFGQGIWMSGDYGATWHGRIDTTSATSFQDCNGYLRIAPNSTASPPTIYAGVPDGATVCSGGFWKSVDGGATWKQLPVDVEGANGSFYAPAVDPYDSNHLVMAVHLLPMIVESTDGGASWTNVNVDPGMVQSISVFAVSFIDTGDAATTKTTWLSLNSADGPGTWRTTDGGAHWTQVALTTHDPGASQIYQPPSALNHVYLGATYDFGRGLEGGVYASSDFGATWSRVGNSDSAKLVFGTTKAIYSMAGEVAQMGSQCSPTSPCQAPLLQSAAQPGTGSWTSRDTPPAMDEGPTWAAVTGDGTHNVLVTANYGAGLWRYVEP